MDENQHDGEVAGLQNQQNLIIVPFGTCSIANKIKHEMCICFLNSGSDDVSEHLDQDKFQLFYSVSFLKLLMQYGFLMTCFVLEAIRDKIHTLHAKDYGSGIEKTDTIDMQKLLG